MDGGGYDLLWDAAATVAAARRASAVPGIDPARWDFITTVDAFGAIARTWIGRRPLKLHRIGVLKDRRLARFIRPGARIDY